MARNRKYQDADELKSDVQSGDTQEIPDIADANSESVEELLDEGNAFEASAVDGVEMAKDPDVSEVTTREVAEDDVPEEYLDDDGPLQ
jgi:N utilization substance protein A